MIAEAVLHPDDESRFDTVTYTYYEQLNGYEYLKQLDLGYYFYKRQLSRRYPQGARFRPQDHSAHPARGLPREHAGGAKDTEVSELLGLLGEWLGKDEVTGLRPGETRRWPGAQGGRFWSMIGPTAMQGAGCASRTPRRRTTATHVDIIIALGMAKEGFDWIWCEHALTVGSTVSSLTEIIQIIGAQPPAIATGQDPPPRAPAISHTNLIGRVLVPSEQPSRRQTSQRHPQGHWSFGELLQNGQVCSPPRALSSARRTRKAARLPVTTTARRVMIRKKDQTSATTRRPATCNSKSRASPSQEQGRRGHLRGRTSMNSSRRLCRTSRRSKRACFANEELVPEELTQVRMGKIVQKSFPNSGRGRTTRPCVSTPSPPSRSCSISKESLWSEGETSGSADVPRRPSLNQRPPLHRMV